MIITALFLLASAPSHVRKVESAACAALHAQFESNERSMASSHSLYQSLVDAALTFKLAVEPSQREADISKIQLAALTGRHFEVMESEGERGYRQSVEQRDTEDKEYLESGDRLTTLLVANKCIPPTHVTSWVTYASK
jgi:hypothetical protein